ncbi:glycosyl transferase domain protein, putative [Microscilla marina ATCC 23134]|uniref:Glycosyl transferase domain protein, putative n=2 Tax=Microscilla marina TaxID=1027 RepID=A1ZZ68_MICM2|nr:glycosyl transferase domain protein, putative [Microscilla marina ATCC 23134]
MAVNIEIIKTPPTIVYLLIPLVIYLLFQAGLLVGLLGHKDLFKVTESKPTSQVTIMIAARNEATNILRCLQALQALDYPKSQLQILIGNDHSTDATAQIIQDFIADKPHFQLINIEQNLGKAKGKANVLAHLAQVAQGEWWLVTDADIVVPEGWVQAMLAALQSKVSGKQVGIVTGFTLVQGKRLFDKFQAIDWAYSLGLIKVWSNWGIPVTAMGNNMGICPAAYRKTGGYEQIPFSITEDFALFQAVVAQGYAFKNMIHPDMTALSEPVSTVSAWLHQRKRWMSGALQAPWFLSLFFGLHSSFWLLLLGLGWFSPFWAMGLAGVKLLIQCGFITITLQRAKQTHLVVYLALFEVYHVTFTWLMAVFYFLPVKVWWKGRKY